MIRNEQVFKSKSIEIYRNKKIEKRKIKLLKYEIENI